MRDESRIQNLVEQALESSDPPEVVCRDAPDLLPEVRSRLMRVRSLEAELGALFPSSNAADRGGTRPSLLNDAELPDIPDYRVDSILGHGGVGVVYKAHHLKLKRPVAIKMLRSGAYASAAERARFRQEAEAVAALRHVNIMQVYDVGEYDGRPYFTMEFIEGGDLAQALAGMPQPAREAAAMIATLADAVQTAHDGGIVHRDLKPANVLLSANGNPKISDFGLARRLERDPSLTIAAARVGTPSYMAPEQAAGNVEAFCPSVDIYALGAMLYEMLTGRPPFRAHSASETQRQVIHEYPAPPSRLNARIPRDLETICLKCLRKEPADRYSSAGALSDDLRRFLDGRPIHARPVSRLERGLRWMRRNPAGAAFIVTAMALSTLAAAFVMREISLAAQRRTEEAHWKERLAFLIRIQEEGRFPEARAILDRVPDAGSAELRAEIERAKADIDIVERLDSIRLSRGAFMQGGGIDYDATSRRYAATFSESGLGELHEDPRQVAARLAASPIRKAIVAALDDWATCAAADPRAWILTVARSVDPDPWRDRVRDQDHWADLDHLQNLAADAVVEDQPVNIMVAMGTRWRRLGGDPTAFLERVQRAYPNDFWVNFELGHLYGAGNVEAAIGYCRAALAVRPRASVAHFNLGVYVGSLGRRDEAMHYFERVIESDPNHTWARVNLGVGLLDRFRPGEALKHFEHALALDPHNTAAVAGHRHALIGLGRGAEAAAPWRAAIDADPQTHDVRDGYAEFCLFVGDEAEYRQACSELLEFFGSATDPHLCERTGRACLLAPLPDEQRRQAAALIDRALSADPSQYAPWARPYFLLAKALSEYRSGRFESAANLLQGDVLHALPPAPQLILAMVTCRMGQVGEARRIFAEAVASIDWRLEAAGNREAWIYHTLRREAEALIRSDDR